MAVENVIKNIQDIMREDSGVDGDAQRIGQLTWMLFLKIYDDKESEYEQFRPGYKPAIPDGYRWRNWATDDEGLTGDALTEFVNNKLFPALKGLEVNHANEHTLIIKEVFADANNYVKSGTILRRVINKLNEIDFNRQGDKHLFNDIYETLLKDLQSAGNSGEFYTPRPVTKFVTEMTQPKLGDRILDPACGTGGFLINAIEYIRKQHVKTAEDEQLLQDNISGVEKKHLPHLLCMTNLILHGIEVPKHIKRDNSLSRPTRDYSDKDRVDVILTNPPFGGTEEKSIATNFPKAFQTTETADLFVYLTIQLLKTGGRAGIVLPDSFLSGDGVKARLKEHLFEKCNLHTIVRLPKGVFYALVSTSLFFFNKGEPTKDIWFYELPLPKGLKQYNKGNPMTHQEFEPVKQWWVNRKQNEYAWKVSAEQVAQDNYNLHVPNPSQQATAVYDKEELLKQAKSTAKEITDLVAKIKEALK